jgi:bifunctional DNA-binding transcriptional regulator/antitoxin component of YhaV-PrlF toxin-antitoxin module
VRGDQEIVRAALDFRFALLTMVRKRGSMQVLARSRLTSKEQLSLPVAIRRLLGIQAGDELVWMKDENGRLLVESARRHALADIRAAVAALGPTRKPTPVSLRAMRQGIADHLRAKHGRH